RRAPRLGSSLRDRDSPRRASGSRGRAARRRAAGRPRTADRRAGGGARRAARGSGGAATGRNPHPGLGLRPRNRGHGIRLAPPRAAGAVPDARRSAIGFRSRRPNFSMMESQSLIGIGTSGTYLIPIAGGGF